MCIDLSEESVIHIIPIGFEVDRVLYGLIELASKKIYFLYDNKEDDWGNEARRYTNLVKEKLMDFNYNFNNVVEYGFDPTSYESCEKTIKQIIEREKRARKIYINVSTSTKICAIAATIQAMNYKNIFLYYVVPEKYNIPAHGRPFSSGAKRMEIFSPRSFKISDMEESILDALSEKTYSSLGELNKEIIPDDVSKSSRAKLSYYVRKLQREEFVIYNPGSEIMITRSGLNRLNPIKDDAEHMISQK